MVIDAAIRTVREQITDRLRDDILTGRLAEGARLQEAKLAERSDLLAPDWLPTDTETPRPPHVAPAL